MSFSSAIYRVLSKSNHRKAREERRRKALNDFRRRRIFEALEQRQMLDAASLYETLPETITIADGNSYHYAFEGTASDLIDGSSVNGLTASLPSGTQVSMTVSKTDSNGVVSSLGEIVVQLFEADGEAPNSSAHFLDLVADEYYEGLTIHRIYSGFMFQGGSSDGYGYDGSGTTIANETSDVLTHSTRGIVAYANKGVDTSDAQFYITFDSAAWLDGSYNVFGFVVDGYDVVEQLENAEVTTNPKSGENTFPTSTYTLSNVHVLEDSEVSQGVLRLVSDDDASGVTTLSFTSRTGDDALLFQETTVYAGEDGLEAYVQQALSDVKFEFVAGDLVSVDLPTEFGGYTVSYTVSDVTGTCGGYEIVSNSSTNSSFDLVTTKAAAQYTSLQIVATLANGDTATVIQPMYISPAAPELTLAGTDTTIVKEYGDETWIVSSDLATSAIQLTVDTYTFDSSVALETPLTVYVDERQCEYQLVSSVYDEDIEKQTYVLSLQLDDNNALADGDHTISVQECLAIDRVTTHSRLVSEVASARIIVDSQAPKFTNSETTIDVQAGEEGSFQLTTNKTDSSGEQRADIKFELADPEAGPSFITLTEYGLLSWSNVTESNKGVYDVDVVATDALGRTAATTLEICVGTSGKPVFEEIEDYDAVTGETFTAIIAAGVPGDEDAPVVYSLVGDHPDGLTIDPVTGVITWNVPGDYLDDVVSAQLLSINVQATSQIKQDDGTYVDGRSSDVEQVMISVENATVDDESVITPVWAQTYSFEVNAGQSVQSVVNALVDSSAFGVLYTDNHADTDSLKFDLNEETGEFVFDVAENYFEGSSVRSTQVTVEIAATTVLNAEEGKFANLSGSKTTPVVFTILNQNYSDVAPIIIGLSDSNATTGQTYQDALIAYDPNQEADAFKFELVGTDYPEGLVLSTDGTISWTIPDDYLSSNVASRVLPVAVKVTEQYLQEDGTYEDGLSTDGTVEIRIANANYDPQSVEAPEFVEPGTFQIYAGAVFETVVRAGVPEGAYGVEYGLVGNYPEGMTIDSTTGEISWKVPGDYFTSSSTRKDELTIEIQATTVVNADGTNVDYGKSSTTSLGLTVLNPDYVDEAPVLTDIDQTTIQTGENYTTAISVGDPNGETNFFKIELVGDNYPEGFTLVSESYSNVASISWDVPADYSGSNVKTRVMSFVVKASEIYKLADGTDEYVLSSEKTYTFEIANATYDETSAYAPVWQDAGTLNVVAGETFEQKVVATVPDEYAGVKYELIDAPEGMTFDENTGTLSWNVPQNYFSSSTVRKAEVEIKLAATAIVASNERSVDYGAKSENTLKLTINNPNYVDEAPVVGDLDVTTAKTGETFVATFTAVDPNGEADDVQVALADQDYPEGFQLVKGENGQYNVSWAIPEDYLSSNVQTREFTFSVVATERYLKEDGTYETGLTSEKTFNVAIENAAYNDEESEAPTWTEFEAQETTTGETFNVTAVATAPNGAQGVEYELTGDYPKGMTIDAETGAISWNVPQDYIESTSVKSETLTINVKATTVVSTDGSNVDYGKSSSSSFELKVNNANYVDLAPVFDDDWNSVSVSTGDWIEKIVSASDPEDRAASVRLELVGDDYPDGLTLKKNDDGQYALAWDVPQDWLDANVSSAKIKVVVKATEIYASKDEGKSEEEGLSTTKTYEINVANTSFDETKAIAPEWTEIEAQSVDAGETFELTVAATASDDDTDYDVEYALIGEYPEGMTIDSESGKIVWAVPGDYFDDETVESETLKIELQATTILSTEDVETTYGSNAKKSFDLTVLNPDYIGKAPVFDDLETVSAATGTTYETTIKATDPDDKADKIVYELIGENYPEDFSFNAETGAVTWDIPEDYLDTDVVAQTFKFTIKATERFLQEDETYVDGLSTEKTFEVMVANAKYDTETAVTPVWNAIDAQTVAAGETLELTVSAKLDSEDYTLAYALSGEYPEGMTIDSESGKITWNVPEDYFGEDVKTRSKTITVELKAQTVVSSDEHTLDVNAEASTSFEVTVTNPNYKSASYDDWYEWFDAWVANEQTRAEGHATNLSDYLSAYLAAVDARAEKIAEAQKAYANKETTLTEFLQARSEAQTAFDDAVNDARIELSTKDAQVDSDYASTLEELNRAHDELAQDTNLTRPQNVESDAETSGKQAVSKVKSDSNGNSNFRLKNSSTGASVGTDLTSILKLWRSGYSRTSVYSDIYSDSSFTESLDDDASTDDGDDTEVADDDTSTGEDDNTEVADDDTSTEEDDNTEVADDNTSTDEDDNTEVDEEEDVLIVDDEDEDDGEELTYKIDEDGNIVLNS